MAALGNAPRLAAMLVSAKSDDEAATAAKIAAILEEPSLFILIICKRCVNIPLYS